VRGLHPTHRIPLQTDLANHQIVSMTVSPTGRLSILSYQAAPHSTRELPATYQCCAVDATAEFVVHIQPQHDLGLGRVRWCHDMPDGRRLWVGARGSQQVPNGCITRATGAVERHIFLGDGIASVQVTPTGTIWVGYYDEGLFGNAGWLHPAGGVGLVALASDGTVLHTDADLRPQPMPMMVDDSQVTVVDDHEVWYCYQHRSSYGMLAVRDRKAVYVGDLPVRPGPVFAVGTRHILVVDRHKDLHRLAVFDRASTAPWLPRYHGVLQTPDGYPITGRAYVARGSMLWVYADHGLYGIDADTL
jgi:hypothetical protein